jgi:hypothetical protein
MEESWSICFWRNASETGICTTFQESEGFKVALELLTFSSLDFSVLNGLFIKECVELYCLEGSCSVLILS